MKTLGLFATGLAGWLVLALAAQAQERQQRRPEGPVLLPASILERLDLTAEQKEKIAKLEKDFQAKIGPARKKAEDAIRQKLQEVQEAFRREVVPIHEALEEKLGQLLTEEQRRRLGELSERERGRPGFDLARIVGQLNLTEEQKQKIGKLMQEFGEEQEVAGKKHQEAVEQARQNQDRAKVRELIQAHEKERAKGHEELQAKVQALLTDGQKKKFAEVQQRRRPEGGPPSGGHILPPPLQERLGLTPEQREKVAKLQKDTEAKLKEILNEEQNKRLEELKKGRVPERPRRKE